MNSATQIGSCTTWPHSEALTPLKYCVTCNQKTLSENTAPETLFEYIDISSVNDIGEISALQVYNFSEAPSRARRIVRKGDVIISTVRTYLKAIALIDEKNESAICSTGFAVLSPKNNVCSKYLYYALLSDSFTDQVVAFSTGISYPAITSEKLLSLTISLPIMLSQKKIASYIDRYCKIIDRLISLQEEMIAELQAYKQSVITEAVTKGIDPNVPMKDSGVEWIGNMPMSWTVGRLGMLARIITGNTPSKNDNDLYYSEEGMMWIKPDNLNELKPITITSEYLNDAGVQHANVVQENTPLICCIGSIGKYGFSSSPAAFNQQINAVMFFEKIIHWKFGLYSIASQNSQHMYYANGNVLKILNTTNQKRIAISNPPYSEQVEIVEYLDRRCSKIDHIISLKIEKINILKEYKKSLIYECVTGKREVV